MSALEEIKARAEKATPGPWTWAGTAARHVLSGDTGPVLACASLLYPDPKNEQFIAHARTDVPKLVAALEAVEDLLLTLDTIEACQPSGHKNWNLCAGGTADVLRTAITEALA